MSNNKFCINRSVFLLFLGVVFFFFIFAFYQKISNTAVVKNNQAAERITTVCTYVVGLGEGSSSVFSTLGINVYSPPKDFSQYINWNGSKTAAVVIQKKIYPLSFQQGDIVSLMPTDHIKIPCQGEYLGNVFKQDFDDPIINRILKSYSLSMNGLQNPITAVRLETNLKNLCDQQAWHIASYHPDQSLSLEDMGCNFITVTKTTKIGGETACHVYDTAGEAYSDFLSYSNPLQFKWYSVAMLGKKTGCSYDPNNVTRCYFGIKEGNTINANLAQQLLCP